ncbi:hypothetical protein BRADI_1g32466v3 [Brachypodium distachyon]|uniref:Uncharacterized protein n=1 Tax=Brachypodium distachyon TaxID=15368 RepID=A0A0Q3RW54_BRADI|nr:hypothetical protein BRADI_1g32466v3 [Brachypodium distachyon]
MANEPGPVIGDAAGLDHVQRLFLDVGRVSVLGGWVVVTCSFGNPAADAAYVFLGFALLVLGVLLLTLSPAAHQFPWVARVGAVVARAILRYLFVPED